MKPTLSFINQYLLLDLLHTGTTSELFRAIEIGEEGFKRTVILKRFLSWVSDEKRFIDEYFQKMDRYFPNDNPFYIANIENGCSRGIYFQTREYFHGQSLEKCIHIGRTRSQSLPLELSIFITAQLVQSLKYFYELPADYPDWTRYHGHLTSSTIMIGYEGNLKILNYGIDWLKPLYYKRAGLTTAPYLPYSAPEVILEEEVDVRSDFFSIGTLFYEMITGQQLFYNQDQSKIRQMILTTDIPLMKGKVPKKIEEMIRRLVARDPKQRYDHPDEILADISILIDLKRRAELTSNLKKYMGSVFKQEIDRDLQKIAADRERYSKMLDISIEGEDKFLEPTAVTKLSELARKQAQQDESSKPSEDHLPFDEISDDAERPMSPEEVGDYLDHALKELLGKPKDHPPSSNQEISDQLFKKEWNEIQYDIDHQKYTEALDKLKILKESFPEHEEIDVKLEQIQTIVTQELARTFQEGQGENSQERTQPTGHLTQSIRALQQKDQEKETQKSLARTFSLINLVLWILLITVGLLLGYMLFIK
ncbi:serine/threonine protein kinase [candidate division CSSED10-310 bacterium]|uniref:Serine/threonine protein kinase n=1 Tax=candidate division CSSED10-310 bacterium TaxID=2855610 RepID=A0ABV6Z533_UNCC1